MARATSTGPHRRTTLHPAEGIEDVPKDALLGAYALFAGSSDARALAGPKPPFPIFIANPALAALAQGRGAAALEDRPFADLFAPEAREGIVALLERAARRGGKHTHVTALPGFGDRPRPTELSAERIRHPLRCFVDVIGEDLGVARVARAGSGPAGPEALAAIEAIYAPDAEDSEAVGRTGEAALETDVAEGWLLARAGAATPAAVRRLGIRSSILVPLAARGRTLGAITLLATVPRRFCREHLALAEEVGRRAALALDNARLLEEARRAVALRDEFISVASHELKTPLSALKLFLAGLSRGKEARALGDLGPERLQETLASIERQADRLLELVRNLLDVARLRGGQLDIEPDEADLAAIAGDVVRRLAGEAAAAGSRLHLSAPGAVHGRFDRLRIDQAITNLVANAIKYGAGMPIDVAVAEAAGRGRIVVRDQGIGIAPEDRARIFRPFERTAAARHAPGLGLGLYIVSQIVEAHGGTIVVESSPGAGSTFTIELPLELPPKETS